MSDVTNVTIVGVNSDIGYELGYRYIAKGCRLQGTYRDPYRAPDRYLIAEGSPFPNSASPYFLQMDVNNQNHMIDAAEAFEGWDLLLFCVGTLKPIGKFTECNPFQWQYGVRDNALDMLTFLNLFWERRRPGASVVFFAGPNIEKRSPTYTAYHAAKALLTDFTRELAHEEPAHRVFMLAPGVVQTRIHQQTLEAGERAANLERVRGIVDGREETTSHDEIYACLEWCLEQPIERITGRCVHVKHDPWRGGHLRA